MNLSIEDALLPPEITLKDLDLEIDLSISLVPFWKFLSLIFPTAPLKNITLAFLISLLYYSIVLSPTS